MQRFKLIVEYDGTFYSGWQKQKTCKSVQNSIEKAVYQLCKIYVKITAAGRTDSGVHALGQVIHFDLDKKWDLKKIRDGINFYLMKSKESISILEVKTVHKEFNARFSAIKRHYLYRILNRKTFPTIDKQYCWWISRNLNEKKMHEAAFYLKGFHDFTAFRSVKCQSKNSLRTIDNLNVVRYGNWIEIHVSARSFLHNQIRSFVGSLVNVGYGLWSSEDLKNVLESCDRRNCGVVAPARGLYLVKVDYNTI